MLQKFANSESGATLVEYGVAMLIAIVVGGTALGALTAQTGFNFEAACEALQFGEEPEIDCEGG